MSNQTSVSSVDLVPLAERLRYLRLFRVGAAAAILACWPLLPEIRHIAYQDLALATGVYLALSFGIEGLWHLRKQRARHTQTVMLLLDGLYLNGACYLMGGVGSPLRTLIVVHLVVVTLLASFRTGLKLALWHSLLLYLAFYAQEAGLLESFGLEKVQLGDADFRLLIAWIGAFWIASLATAAFAAVNERELRRQRYDLQALAQLAYRFEEGTRAQAVGTALVEAVADDFGCERTLLLGRPMDKMIMLAEVGVGKHEDLHLSGGGSVLVKALDRRDAVLVSAADARHDPWLSKLLPNPGNLLIVPMHAEKRSIGILIAEHSMKGDSRVERRAVTMLERFVSQAALALMQAWLLEQLEHSAATDSLTGLANRGSLEESLRSELAHAQRTGDPVALVMFDIDHFKQLNDTYGHRAGDNALRLVGGLLREHVRMPDVAARYGGEEFAVLLRNAKEEGAMVLAERLREKLAVLPSDPSMTASFGVASYEDGDGDLESLVRTADTALYRSKRTGRNRTTAASTLTGVTMQGSVDGAEEIDKTPVEPQHGDALRDPLTGLPNRPLLLDHLAAALARARREETTIALLLIDVDRLKLINDSLGHDAGDRLLVSVARRLDHEIRATDTVARIGGDEFAWLGAVTDAEHALAIAQRLLDALAEPLTLGGEEVPIHASVGVALSSDGAERPQDLLRDADAAMYRAKELGSHIELFDEALRGKLLVRIGIEKGLRKAVEDDELEVLYQPLVNLRNSRIVGFEALVRWQDPERGVVLPGEFITVAEDTGLIVPIGRHVLEEACEQGALWRAAHSELDLSVAVNLSGRQLVGSSLAPALEQVLTRTGLSPGSLILEITENIVMDDLEHTVKTLEAIRNAGVRLAVDDFGTGHSSLGCLRRLPVDTVKVDRSLMIGVGTHREDHAIVEAVKGMADALGLSLVAEGVETPDQLRALVKLGYETGQGMLFSAPLTAAEATELLRSGNSLAIAA